MTVNITDNGNRLQWYGGWRRSLLYGQKISVFITFNETKTRRRQFQNQCTAVTVSRLTMQCYTQFPCDLLVYDKKRRTMFLKKRDLTVQRYGVVDILLVYNRQAMALMCNVGWRIQFRQPRFVSCRLYKPSRPSGICENAWRPKNPIHASSSAHASQIVFARIRVEVSLIITRQLTASFASL